jgi:hypothetical protein
MDLFFNLRSSKSAILLLAIASTAIIFIFSCSLLEPDEEIIQNAIRPCVQNMRAEIINFKILNKYKREIDGETNFFYETRFKLKNEDGKIWPEGQHATGTTVSIVKRGNSWYRITDCVNIIYSLASVY